MAAADIVQTAQEIVLKLMEKIVHVAVVRVKCAAVYVREIGHVAHRDAADVLFEKQRRKRAAKLFFCFPYPTVLGFPFCHLSISSYVCLLFIIHW